MKSSYELAMERLSKAAPAVKLTEAQKTELHELESKYAAKVAEREIFLKGEMDRAAGKGDWAAMEEFQQQLGRDRRALLAELEEKKEAVRQKSGGKPG
jgi:hypothetical protein